MTTSVLRGVRALVFDVFGTVVDWRSGVAREAGHSWRDMVNTMSILRSLVTHGVVTILQPWKRFVVVGGRSLDWTFCIERT
jgi:hypothetical protein